MLDVCLMCFLVGEMFLEGRPSLISMLVVFRPTRAALAALSRIGLGGVPEERTLDETHGEGGCDERKVQFVEILNFGLTAHATPACVGRRMNSSWYMCGYEPRSKMEAKDLTSTPLVSGAVAAAAAFLGGLASFWSSAAFGDCGGDCGGDCDGDSAGDSGGDSGGDCPDRRIESLGVSDFCLENDDENDDDDDDDDGSVE